jgi:hypothetical protein
MAQLVGLGRRKQKPYLREITRSSESEGKIRGALYVEEG